MTVKSESGGVVEPYLLLAYHITPNLHVEMLGMTYLLPNRNYTLSPAFRLYFTKKQSQRLSLFRVILGRWIATAFNGKLTVTAE